MTNTADAPVPPDGQLLRGPARRRAPAGRGTPAGGPSRGMPARPAALREPAAALPVARVAVDVPLAHLDRPFDYLVPAELAGQACVGSRVRVRFAGRLVDGFVLARLEGSEHQGTLTPVAGAASGEPVLSAEVVRLARAVADRYAGTLADVLRLAVPPRHARTEVAPAAPADERPPRPPPPDPRAWSPYDAGPAYLSALAGGGAPRAVWTALPGRDWAADIAASVRATLAGGRGALVVVPDARDVARVDAALAAGLGDGAHVALTADLGPAERYRRFLAVSRGAVRAVVGTRAAMFAPVADLGLAVVWDDGDDLHAEPRAPYPHVREVLVLRAHLAGAAMLVGGHAMTAEGAALLSAGWARRVTARRSVVRAAAPRVEPVADDTALERDPAARAARLPTVAWRAARAGLESGAPVLVQVPRRGYQPSMACARCRAPARCVACAGPLARAGRAAAAGCRWCGRLAADFRCPACGGTSLRASVVGARRTAEELGRAFPGVPVRTSGRDAVLDSVPAAPALVVATPGAEPVADGGYATVLLLDAWALLARPDLRASEETLRRWLRAAALARPAAAGGRVVVTADAALPTVQALVRWDPGWHAQRELEDRQALGFPPAVRMAAVVGPVTALADLLGSVVLPASAEVLGPVPVERPAGDRGGGLDRSPAAVGAEPTERALVRVPRGDGPALAAALKAALGGRSARKAGDALRVMVDPVEVG